MSVMSDDSVGQNAEIIGSDPDAYRQVVREILARLLFFSGSDEPGVLRDVIESVRELVEPGYTVGDLQVDQQIVASRDADARMEKAVMLVEHRDRALLLGHVTQCLASSGEISVDGAQFLEETGVKLNLSNEDIEHIVLLTLELRE